MSRRSAAVPLAFALLFFGPTSGCNPGPESSSSPASGEEETAPTDPSQSGRADLPDPPPESAFDVRETYDDGAFRVRGLVLNRQAHLGTSIDVRGVVTRISDECEPTANDCPRPHLLIGDSEEARDRLMVVGFPRDFLDRADLQEGSTDTFTGTYKKFASGFVASKNGLLSLERVGDETVAPGD